MGIKKIPKSPDAVEVQTANALMNKTRIFTEAPLGSIPELPAMSCLEIKASEGNSTISGKYWLDPTGTGRAILIDCDMASGGRS